MEPENYKAASKREESDAGINSSEREQARTHRVQMMMLDIDGVLSRHGATAVDLLTAAQQIAVSAIGHLVNHVGESSGTGSADTLHLLADDIAEQIRAALHKRIAEGKKPDW